MNDGNYIISTTYFKLLLNRPELVEMLQTATQGRYTEWFETDYIDSVAIQPVFSAFANSGVDSWVMRFGDSLDSTTHGPLGFCVLSAPNLRTALRIFCDYSCIRATTHAVQLNETAEHLSITAQDQTGSELIDRWMIEASMKAAQRLIESLMGHPLKDNAVIRFAHPEPSYADELESFFGIPCGFNAKESSFSIPASWGSIASPLADAGAYQTNLAKCKELKLKLTQQNDVLTLVKLRLEKFLNDCYSGQSTPSSLPSLNDLASELALSSRTLARRLEQKNSSYKFELEAARRKQAKHLLLNTHLRIADIAYYLGYQEPANFIRAFKKWFKVSPSQWRRSPPTVNQ